MRVQSILVASCALLVAALHAATFRTASAKDAEALRVGEAVVAFAKGTMAGGEFVLELTADGAVGRLEAQVPTSDAPKACLEASEKEAGGGSVTRVDRQWIDGEVLWQVTREVDGMRRETLMKDDGTVVGSEVETKADAVAKGVLEASEKAAPGSELVVVERITGPEALGKSEWHVKRRLDGEVLRISVLDDLTIGRVYRKVAGETKVPR